MEKIIIIDYGNQRMRIPEDDLQHYLDASKWLIEQHMKVRPNREEAEYLFGIRIVKEETDETS